MSYHDEDDRPRAVVLAEQGADVWAAVVRHQLSATPYHADFYGLAGDICSTLRALEDLAHVLALQVDTYDAGRRVYDDSREVDPRDRLATAVRSLRSFGSAVAEAQTHANAFWSTIGHIGVEVTP